MSADKNAAAVELGTRGGNRTRELHGREHYVAMGRMNRKPDDQVKPQSLRMRKYRDLKRKLLAISNLPIAQKRNT